MYHKCQICAVRLSSRWTGAYVLRIRFSDPAQVKIGRANDKNPVHLAVGEFVYAGSAMGRGHGHYLPKRLLRHLSRTDGLPDQTLRSGLMEHFLSVGIPIGKLETSAPKKLFWNIDYVLNAPQAEVIDILYVRSDRRLESVLVQCLEERCDTSAPVQGLGAHDHPGHSHFLALSGGVRAWEVCRQRLIDSVSSACNAAQR